MRLKAPLFSPLLCLVLLGCSNPSQPRPANVTDSFHAPSDFSLKYRRGNGDFLSTLLVSTYTAGADGKVTITEEYVREIKTEERQLSPEQTEILARRAGDERLLAVIRQADSLRNQCQKKATDQPTRQLEYQWAGQRVEVLDDFDPEKCMEVRILRDFTDDIPRLLQGNVIKAESRKAPWPR